MNIDKQQASDIDHIFEILEETLGSNNMTFSSKLRNQEIIMPTSETATHSEKVEKRIQPDQNQTPKEQSGRYYQDEATVEHQDTTHDD